MRKFLRLEKIVKPIISNLGYQCIGINYDHKKKHIYIFITKEKNVINEVDCKIVHSNLIYVLRAERYIVDNKYNIKVSSKGINNILLYQELKKSAKKIIKVSLSYCIDNKLIIFGKLLSADKVKQKMYIQNKKKIILLYFYQIDKIEMI